MTRIEKATKYMNNHKSKKCIMESKKIILSELEIMPACDKIVHGCTYGFIKAVTSKFKSCFYAQEYMDILTGLTDTYTDKQMTYYNWV